MPESSRFAAVSSLRILQLLMQLVIARLIALQLLERGAEASDFLTGAAEFDPGFGRLLRGGRSFLRADCRNSYRAESG